MVTTCESSQAQVSASAAGLVTFTVAELEIPVLPEARLTVYTPADERTRARLPLTRRPR
jgi:hypothetical protein